MKDYEIARVVREVVKVTDISLREIAYLINQELHENEDLSEYEITLANELMGTFERIWPREGLWAPGPDARLALSLIQKALERSRYDDFRPAESP